LPAGAWPTLLDYLAQRFPAVAREEWTARMLRGDVMDAHGRTLQPESAYFPYAKIYYYRSLPPESAIPFEEAILYQDEYLVAVDKPHFLPVVPSGRYLQETLLVRLKRRLGIDTLAPVHRIDRETAGIVVFSVQPLTRGRYQALFRQRSVVKCYEAIAPYRPELAFPLLYQSRIVEGASFMTMQEVTGEPNAITRIELLDIRGALAHYRLHPETGQRHQLRVQMAALNMPILNDRIYPVLLPEEDPVGNPQMYYRSPLQLLAKSLSFKDPVTGEARYFESRYALHLQ
jgi:tRNA pseudouridine32 synthase/23S rRNA pseudouridine746 synthase